MATVNICDCCKEITDGVTVKVKMQFTVYKVFTSSFDLKPGERGANHFSYVMCKPCALAKFPGVPFKAIYDRMKDHGVMTRYEGPGFDD